MSEEIEEIKRWLLSDSDLDTRQWKKWITAIDALQRRAETAERERDEARKNQDSLRLALAEADEKTWKCECRCGSMEFEIKSLEMDRDAALARVAELEGIVRECRECLIPFFKNGDQFDYLAAKAKLAKIDAALSRDAGKEVGNG